MSDREFDRVAREYDAQAPDYRASTELPIRTFSDHFMVRRVIGDAAGKQVLDLACGEGHYSRLLRSSGAAEVVGVDISAEMIRLAEEAEATTPLGCRYLVADVATLRLERRFDLVLGNYLLNYATDRRQLSALCHAIACHLEPGGRFVGLNLNMQLAPADYPASRSYGFEISAPDPRSEGDTIVIEITNPDGSHVTLENRYLAPETYSAAFAEAGFDDLAWRGPWVSEEGLARFPPGYWDAFLSAPASLCLEARLAR